MILCIKYCLNLPFSQKMLGDKKNDNYTSYVEHLYVNNPKYWSYEIREMLGR